MGVLQLKREIIVTELLEVVLDGTVVLGSKFGPSVLGLELRPFPALLLWLWLLAVADGRESELECPT